MDTGELGLEEGEWLGGTSSCWRPGTGIPSVHHAESDFVVEGTVRVMCWAVTSVASGYLPKKGTWWGTLSPKEEWELRDG